MSAGSSTITGWHGGLPSLLLRGLLHQEITRDKGGDAEPENPWARTERTGDQDRFQECGHPEQLQPASNIVERPGH